MRLVLGREEGVPPAAPEGSAPRDRADAVKLAKRARVLTEGVTGDLLRAAHTRSLDDARRELARATAELAAEPPIVAKNPRGPFDLPGTYVVVLRAERTGVRRIARLGTFGFPEGYRLYVGRAFGAEGVAGRAARHLGGTGPRLWGVDHLRGFAAPVELWWAHHNERVECPWAMALARPGAPVRPRAPARATASGARHTSFTWRSGPRSESSHRCSGGADRAATRFIADRRRPGAWPLR